MRFLNKFAAVLVCVLLVGAASGAAAASPHSRPVSAGAGTTASTGDDTGSSVWHRLSLDQSHPAPEHERLACVPIRDNLVLFCHYDKVREPLLNFYWNTNQGYFIGADVTAGWACPAWFPAGVCSNVTRVAQGQIVFVDPGVHAHSSLTRIWSLPARPRGSTCTGSAGSSARGSKHSRRQSPRTRFLYRSAEPGGPQDCAAPLLSQQRR